MTKKISISDEVYETLTGVMTKYKVGSVSAAIAILAKAWNLSDVSTSVKSGSINPGEAAKIEREKSEKEVLAAYNKRMGTSFKSFMPLMRDVV